MPCMTMDEARRMCAGKSDSWLVANLLRGRRLGLDHQVRLCAELLVERGYTGEAQYDPFGDPTVSDVVPAQLVAGFKDWLKEEK